ncbi:hypothetical protein [Streptomyces sp. SP18BB07]|uniref:hypothetical protein n=1 Tax=Streptomyces sp. SP18BB07 TaxID=3002522 RepID=UPI002E7A55DA|nr:hypothetical protein [Streptomyces sp. SP18BB07]MEE1759788.1 hypothetical protein [Streptomyces sp. SP18BB07]
MALANPGGLVTRRATSSDCTELAGIDSVAAAGDHARGVSIRRWCEQGVGTHLLKATEARCTTPKLFTSTNVSNHPMQRLRQFGGRSPVGLLHGLDEGDPELFYRCPNIRLRGRADHG